MNTEEVIKTIEESGVIAVIRMKDGKKAADVVQAVADGGVLCIEVTLTVPGAVELLRTLTEKMSGKAMFGAGTVLTPEAAEAVIGAGAKFVVSPILNPAVIDVARRRGVVVVPGCYSPTEILTAWNAGADFVKVFPATSLGPSYLKDIHGPLPDVKLIPTGGVSIDNVGDWIRAGAAAVGIGSDLLDKKAIEQGTYQVLTERAAKLVSNIRQARSGGH